ncbi:NADH dehydrogenase subunit l, partial [mine drainage metagenome]
MQVMEAPTSVSALMHAGVVNLGGFVLIRLAPLISASLPAQGLLVVIGSTTATLAGLTLMTCPSLKGRLAWST